MANANKTLTNPLTIDLHAYTKTLGVTLPRPTEFVGSEELVFEKAIRPILLSLSYDSTDFYPKPSTTHPIIGKTRESDWGIYKYSTLEQEGKLISLFGMVIDVKAHNVKLTQDMLGKLSGYCALSGSKFGILANDKDLIVIKPTNGIVEWDHLDHIPTKDELKKALKILPKYSSSDKIFAKRITSFVTIDEKIIEQIAIDCNNIIRRRKGLQTKDRLYEFSKLLLLRIQDERDFVEGKKKQLDITYEALKDLKSRKIDIQKHVNILFNAVANKSEIFSEDERIELNDGVIEETVRVLDVHALWLKKIEILGQVYEKFLMHTMTGRELGEYFTPRTLVDLTVQMVDPNHGDKILDPSCGTGGFLINSLFYINSKPNGKANASEFYGIDIDDYTHKLAKINSWLHNDSHKNIYRADSLDPKHAPAILIDALRNPEEDGIDVILTNPPFGATGKNKYEPETIEEFSKNWGSLGIDLFECGVNQKGLIPQIAFIELCVKALKKPKKLGKGGRLGTIIDFGIFSNTRNEEPAVRKILRRDTIIEAIIGLPKGSFKMYGSNVIPCILVLRRKSENEDQGPIFRAELSKIGYVPGATRYRIDSDDDIIKVKEYWDKWSKSKGIRS